MKEYKLLKDLPDLEAGAIFEENREGLDNNYWCKSRVFYPCPVVENNPAWFKEVKEVKEVKEDEGFNALAKMLAMNIEELHKIKDSLMNMEDFYE